MCDCVNELTDRLKTKLIEDLKKNDTGFINLESARFAHRIFPFSGSGKNPATVALNFNYEYLRKLKNDKEKIKKDSTNILPSYCPFCGKPYNE